MPEEIMNQRPVSESGNKKGLVLVGMIVVVAIVFGFGGYYLGKNKSVSEPATPAAQTAIIEQSVAATSSPVASAAADETADWKTYTNDTYGFSFKYPSKWGDPSLQTDRPSTDPVEVIGYSNKITFPSNSEDSVTVGFSTADFSAPRHANYWESAPKTGRSCSELETNPVIIKGSCSKTSKGFVTKFDWFGDKPIVGIIYSGYNDYPVFTVSPAEIANQTSAQAITEQVISTFQFTK